MESTTSFIFLERVQRDFPISRLPVEIHLVALEAHPEHLERQRGILFIQHQKHFDHLPVQQITVEASFGMSLMTSLRIIV